MARIRRILCASDFSKASGPAFATAVTMAKSNRATLTILHVFVPAAPLFPDSYVASGTWEDLDAQVRHWDQQQLATLMKKAKKSGVRATTLLTEGDPARQIVRAARSKRADLLVVGTHGSRGFSRLWVGSVAGRVVASAPCPVLTVPGK